MCAKSGVRELRLGSLHIVFGKKDPSYPEALIGQTNPLENVTPILRNEDELANDALTELDELRLSDPFEYERTISEGMSGPTQET